MLKNTGMAKAVRSLVPEHRGGFSFYLCLLAAAAAFMAAGCSGRNAGAASPQNDALVIYSPHAADMIEYIVREFRQRTDINVEIVRGGTGELIDRIKAGADPQTADIIWGGGVESLETIRGCFIPYTSAEDSAIISSFKSRDSLWSPFSVLPVVIMYNKDLVKGQDIPHCWSSLLRPFYRGHLAMADPAVSGSSYTILMTLLRSMSAGNSSYDAGWAYVKKLRLQLGAKGVGASSSAVYNSVASGDFFACITFENSALSLIQSGRKVDYCYPSEGTSAVPDGIALVRGGKHPEQGRQFIDFVLSRDVQSILSSRWHRRSVRGDIESSEIKLSRIRLVDYPIEDSARMRNPLLVRWTEIKSSGQP